MKTIKKLLAVLAILVASVTATAQNTSSSVFEKPSFDDFANEKGVTSVYISKLMMKTLGGLTMGDQRIAAIAKDLNSIEIITCENKDLFDKINNKVKNVVSDNNLEILAKVNDEGENVGIYGYVEGEIVTYILMTIDDKDELVILSMSGQIPLDKVAELAQ